LKWAFTAAVLFNIGRGKRSHYWVLVICLSLLLLLLLPPARRAGLDSCRDFWRYDEMDTSDSEVDEYLLSLFDLRARG
jgi:hypothetical protein